MCMYVCTHARMYVYMYVCTHVRSYVRIGRPTRVGPTYVGSYVGLCMPYVGYVCRHLRMEACTYVHGRVYYVRVYMYLCTYVRMYICTYLRKYVCRGRALNAGPPRL